MPIVVTKSKLSMRRIRAAFEKILSELDSRIWHYARRFSEPAEAHAEMIAFAFRAHRSKAMKQGVLLPAGNLAWVAWRRYASGRVMSGFSTKDALAAQAFRMGRTRVYSLNQLDDKKKRHALADSTVSRITTALTTNEWTWPVNRAQVRIDWAALAARLDKRLRKILHGLTIGEPKSSIAKRVGISNGRLSQLLDVLAVEIRTFFGEELLPDWCIV